MTCILWATAKKHITVCYGAGVFGDDLRIIKEAREDCVRHLHYCEALMENEGERMHKERVPFHK